MTKKIYYILPLLFLAFGTYTKSHFSELVDEQLKNYSEKQTPEKIYIHTDKPYYTLDESIWYTGYLVNGITHEKNSKSWVFYVELINDKDSIVAKKQLFTNNISVAGDFKIGKNWKSGNYLMRAYSNYMKNDNPDYFFQKEIPILSTEKKDELTSTSSNQLNEGTLENPGVVKPDLNFYPEGGDLIENVRSKIAVKIKNNLYQNIKLTGTIVDNKDNLITEFKTTEFGLGAFTLSPEPTKTYFAKLEVNGVEYSYKLPEVIVSGHSLGINNTGTNLLIDVKSNTSKGVNQTYLVVHQRGKLIFSKYETKETNEYSLKLPVTNLKDGIANITLFDSSGNPVCERLTFISNPNNKTSIQIEKSQETISTRKPITINLNVKDSKEENLPSHLSMSVRDLNAFPYNTRSKNIKTWLLLNSDLRGEIKDPGYFFEKDNDPRRRYLLDLVMLTHGWRRFTWKSLLYDSKTEMEFPIEKGLTISGTTKFLRKPYSATPTETRLTFFGKTISQEPIKKSDSNGRFSYGPFIFFDSVQTIVESRLTDFKSDKLKDRKVLILIDHKDNSPEVVRNGYLQKDINDEKQLENFKRMSAYMRQIREEEDQRTQQLEEVTILARKKDEQSVRTEEMNDRTDYGYATNRLDLENDFILGGETVFDLLATVPGVNAVNDSISIRGSNGNPTVLLDNFQVDVQFLTTLAATEVSFVDVLKGADAAMYANSGNGVIAVYSKTGNLSTTRNVVRKPGIIDFAAQGFYTAREFYAPDHINGFEEMAKADIRTTLHWEPKIRTTVTGGQDITFFSSDTEGDYLIEVEGVSESGIPLHAISTFSVQ